MTAPLRLIRTRTLLYAGLICLVAGIMLVALLNRTTLEINALQDRNPPFVRLSDGGVRNGYTIKILNKLHQPREFTLEVKGLPAARLSIVGVEDGAPIRVKTDDVRELKVFVTLPPQEVVRANGGSLPFSLVVRDLSSETTTARGTHFQLPPSPLRNP